MTVVMKGTQKGNAIVISKKIFDTGFTEQVIIDDEVTSRTRYLDRQDVAYLIRTCKEVGARVAVFKN